MITVRPSPATGPVPRDWSEANRRFLAAELRRIGALLDLAAGEDAGEEARAAEADVVTAGAGLAGEPAIDRVAGLFALSRFERDLLLLCAGVELDASIARRCARSTGGPWATFGLALAALPDAHWSAAAPDRPLRSWRLLTIGQPANAISVSPLHVAEPVLLQLIGIDGMDRDVAPLVTEVTPTPAIAAAHLDLVRSLARVAMHATDQAVVQLVGDDADGQEDVASRAMQLTGRRTWMLRAEDLPEGARDCEELSRRWQRDARLLDAALMIRSTDRSAERRVADVVRRTGGVTIVGSPEPLTLAFETARFAVNRPSPHEQRALWLDVLEPAGSASPQELDLLASHFRLSAREIWRAAPRALAAAVAPSLHSIVQAVRPRQSLSEVSDLVTLIEPTAGWSDLVLPDDQLLVLQEIASQVRGRATVHDQWGFGAHGGRGAGIAVLFEGESGTGKTLAAEVLGTELGLCVLRVDLASVVSKYIGETEKNIARVFRAADATGGIILFDEADALFGKRSEVRDSHDRYANIEVSYLLQRMETQRGLAILTTNSRSALDRAFHRRLRFVVRFPYPDAGQRERIWRASIPDRAPRRSLDFERLARLSVAGGDIRNIALNAAFLAAAAQEPITMAHLRSAARRELEKQGRVPTDADLRGWP